MDVSPMSLQMIVPRANEATQVQHNLNQQVNVQQSFAELRDKSEMQMKMETVQSREQAEDGKIKDDPDHRSGHGRQNAFCSGRSPFSHFPAPPSV